MPPARAGDGTGPRSRITPRTEEAVNRLFLFAATAGTRQPAPAASKAPAPSSPLKPSSPGKAKHATAEEGGGEGSPARKAGRKRNGKAKKAVEGAPAEEAQGEETAAGLSPAPAACASSSATSEGRPVREPAPRCHSRCITDPYV